MRSSRMPRRVFPRATTRNSGRAASSLTRASARTDVPSTFTQRLVPCLVEGFQQVMEDGLAPRHDLNRADHARNDRVGLAFAFELCLVGRDLDLVEGLAGLLVDEAVGRDVGDLAADAAEDGKI